MSLSLLCGVGIIVSSAKQVAAHGGHNMEKIQEGEASSPDPIVCWTNCRIA